MRRFFVSLLIVFQLCAISQTGPAGVGAPSVNVLWLKADAGTSSVINGAAVSTWSDQSGNGIHVSQSVAAQQPSFATNVLNGFPGLQFDNVSGNTNADRMIAPDDYRLDNTSGYSFFNVVKMNFIGTDARAIVSKRTAIDVDEAFMLFFWNSNYFYVDIDGLGNRFDTSPITYTTNTGYILDAFYNGNLPFASRSTVYEQEILRKTAAETSTLVGNKPSPLNIACTHSADGRPFGGYISEIIIYTVTVNPAQRIIVNNYLSSKYNIALTANDRYQGDTPANGNFDFEVAGVGREASGSNPSFSASVSGGLGISTTGLGFDNGDYILAGHSTFTNSQITYDVLGMSGTNNARWERIWYLDITNTGTGIQTNVEFDMSDGGVSPVAISTPSNYVLLYRSGLTGAWSELATSSTIVGDRIIFNGFTFVNDGYYTIGTLDHLISPLPVELLNFHVSKEEKNVKLFWETVSENNCENFGIEKLTSNGTPYTLAEVSCKGKDGKGSFYEYTDAHVGSGSVYYRLKQKDWNGRTAYSAWRTITIKEEFSEIKIFPQPNNGLFFIELSSDSEIPEQIRVINQLGQDVSKFIRIEDSRINDSRQLKCYLNLSPGIYTLQMNIGHENIIKRVVIAE